MSYPTITIIVLTIMVLANLYMATVNERNHRLLLRSKFFVRAKQARILAILNASIAVGAAIALLGTVFAA